jgi:hypothetical protein
MKMLGLVEVKGLRAHCSSCRRELLVEAADIRVDRPNIDRVEVKHEAFYYCGACGAEVRMTNLDALRVLEGRCTAFVPAAAA